jgi:uncharacterized protein (DUF3820 family)
VTADEPNIIPFGKYKGRLIEELLNSVYGSSRIRAGKFPRARIVGGKSMWLSTEIDAWLAALPERPLKGDPGSADQ